MDPPYKGQQLEDVINGFLAVIAGTGCPLICELDKRDKLRKPLDHSNRSKDVTYGITRILVYQMEEDWMTTKGKALCRVFFDPLTMGHGHD